MVIHTSGPSRRGFVTAGAAVALGARASETGAATPAGSILSASSFGAVGDGLADDTAALQAALDVVMERGGTVLHIPPGTYKVTRTLRLAPTRAVAGDIGRQNGILAHGARLVSAIADGSNVFAVTSRATVRFLLIEGLDVLGSGKEGHGIVLECDERDNYLYNFCLRDAVVQGCGGDGCRLVGNVFEGQIINSYFRDNKGTGITFAHSKAGGILSAIHVFGCVFGQNGGHGAALVDGCYDVAFHGCYFLLNDGAGLSAPNGSTLLSNCGFENNHARAASFADGGPGIELQSFGTLIGCTAYSLLHQTGLIRAFVTTRLTLVGCSGSGDGAAKGAGLAHLAGTADGEAVVLACTGHVVREGTFEALEIGGPGGGVRFGSDWRSRQLPRLGEYRLWIDGAGRLRMKNGTPQSDEDGQALVSHQE